MAKAKTKSKKPSDIIKERGWCQNEYIDDNGKVCLSKAIYLAYKQDDKQLSDVRQMVQLEIIKRTKGRCEFIIDYNDAPHRRKQDVIKLLEKLGL